MKITAPYKQYKKTNSVVEIDVTKHIAWSIIDYGALQPKSEKSFMATIILQISNPFRATALVEKLVYEIQQERHPDIDLKFISINSTAISYGSVGKMKSIPLLDGSGIDITRFILDNKESHRDILIDLTGRDIDKINEIISYMNQLVGVHRTHGLNLIFIIDKVNLQPKHAKCMKIFENTDNVFEVNDYSMPEKIVKQEL